MALWKANELILDNAFDERALRRLRSLRRSSSKTSKVPHAFAEGETEGEGVNEEPKPLSYLKGLKVP